MGLLSWFNRKKKNLLTEGITKEKVEVEDKEKNTEDITVIEKIQENENNANINENQKANNEKNINDIDELKNSNMDSKIKFSVNEALSEYEDWYKQYYHDPNKEYGGAINIYKFNNGDSVFSLNYKNSDQKDNVVLAIAKIKNDEEMKSNNYKKIRSNLDKMISAVYGRKNGTNYYDLEEYLNGTLQDIESKYDIEFTDEGRSVLLNYDRSFILADRTVILNKENDYVLGYEKLEKDIKDKYNVFDIPDKNSCYPGTVTVTIPIEKSDLSKLNDEKKKEILTQLEELYKSAVNIGIINGVKNDDVKNRMVEQYKNMKEILNKTKYAEKLESINLDDSNELQNNMRTIKTYSMDIVIETSLYYEDLIEEYVNDTQKYESTEKQRAMFSKVLETSKTEYFYAKLDDKKKIEIMKNKIKEFEAKQAENKKIEDDKAEIKQPENNEKTVDKPSANEFRESIRVLLNSKPKALPNKDLEDENNKSKSSDLDEEQK